MVERHRHTATVGVAVVLMASTLRMKKNAVTDECGYEFAPPWRTDLGFPK